MDSPSAPLTANSIRIVVLSQDAQRQQQLTQVLTAIGLQVVISTALDDPRLNQLNAQQTDAILVDLPSLTEENSQPLLDGLEQGLALLNIPIFFDETPQHITSPWANKLVDKLTVILNTAKHAPNSDSASLLRLAIATNAEHEMERLAHILDTLGLKTTIHTDFDARILETLTHHPADALLVDLRNISANDPNLIFFEAFVNELTEQTTLPVYFADTPDNNLESWALKLAAKLTHTPAYQLASRLEPIPPQCKPPVSLAIVFADICGSTHLYESLGDHPAQQLIAKCIQFLTDITHKHKGIVIKTIGDEVMCTFPTADLAVAAALMMQNNLSQTTRHTTPNYTILGIRVGIHFGPVVQESNDVFGDSVNIAARMAALAKSAQIITTGQTIEALSPLSGMHYRHIDRSCIRGKREEFDIFEILSVEEYQFEATVRAAHKIVHKRHAHLSLRYHQQEIVMNPTHPKITLGRNEKNDICIDDALISRFHARIEFYRGKFILYDQSFNGTFIVTYGGEDIFLHRDYMPLQNKGIIALGCTVGNNKHIIFYQCEF